jgi:uncharacterized membrane protein/glycosyltransferase involved in cell wall biosynthesis
MAKKFPLISVVLCSLNGADVISDALKAIKAQKWAGKLEIIVIDDGSTDDTYKIAKSFRGIKVIKNKRNLGTASSRNKGIKAAKGEIIAFTDDDCRPRPTWIKELYAGYTNDKILGVGGEAISNDKSSLTLRYLHYNNPLKPLENKLLRSHGILYRFGLYLKDLAGMNKVPNRKRSVYTLFTANASFRKSALKKIGMFDERFGFGGVDFDLCMRLNSAYPESLWFAPKAKVDHQFNPSLRDTLRRSRAYGYGGNGCMTRKHEDVNPTIYPFPLLIPLTFLLGIINPWYLFTPFVLVLAIYSLGIRMAIKERSLEPLLYSYIQYLQEWYGNIGFIKGWWKFRNTFTSLDSQAKSLEAKSSKTSIDNSLVSKDINFSISASKHNAEKPSEKNNKFWLEAGIVSSILGLVLIVSLIKNITFFHIPAAIAIILVPGYLLLRGFGAERQHRLPGMLHLALSTTAGIAWLMFFGLIADVVLPVFGFRHPLTNDWLPLIFVIATGFLIPWALRHKIAARKAFNFKIDWDTLALSSILILTLLFSFCGARLLNNGYSNILEMSAFGLGLISIVFAVLRQKHLPNNMFPILLFVLSLASVWSYSLRSNYVFGWDIQQEFQVFQQTLKAGNWILGAKHTSYPAMLSLTILPVTIVKITGMAGLTIFKFLSPLLFSFVPVILYYTYRLFTKRWISFVATLVIIAQFDYMQQFSALVRQQIAFLFFAAILYLILETRLSKISKNLLLLCFALGLVVSHYSTTYLAIVFLGGTYIISKIVYSLLSRYKKDKVAPQHRYIHGWLIFVLVIAAFLWYVPATHSNNSLAKFTSIHNYSHIVQNIESNIRKEFNNHSYAPKTTEAYLQTIGKNFRLNHRSLTYYSMASNSSIHPVLQPTIKVRLTILKKLTDGIQIVLSYGWAILGGIGILALIYSVYRKLDYRKLELGILGSIGILACIAIRLIPTLKSAYNPDRLYEQVLMFIALPSMLVFIWLLRKLSVRTIKIITTGTVFITFAIASGIITQFVGGNATANLNNFGADYNSFYVQQSDLASAQWLANNYHSNSTAYADIDSNLRLTSVSSINHDIYTDLTPETIGEGSFVYADYANVKLSIATATTMNTSPPFTYQFPTNFLQKNKNLVYSNGYSEVYK